MRKKKAKAETGPGRKSMFRERSLIGRINRMSRLQMTMLLFPVVVSLAMMLLFSVRYHASIQRMERVASLKPVVAEEIPEGVWQVISGRVSPEESGVDDRIAAVQETIRGITGAAAEKDQLELVVAERTMDTLTQYVNQVWDNMRESRPVVESEQILEEIRGVAGLVETMLNDYITQEIRNAGRMSVELNRAVLVAAGGELMLLIFSLLLMSRASRRTARFVRQPIEALESGTDRLAGGDLSARIPETDVVELKKLTDQVNVMADNLESTMRQNVQDARNLKKAELRTLQAQINPHFLYNTLDAIVWKAEAGDQKEVIHLTSALSDFFRISLSAGADWIPISQEKKHITGYLSIQQTRYRDILKYEIDIPEEIGGIYILKLLLQPLVENALYHGIKNTRGGGTIRVVGRKNGETLEFRVSDTGRGMDADTLARLRERMAEGQPAVASGTGGFGLVNVNLRIRLYYNQQEGLRIESGPGGTQVSFRVPCRSREELTGDDQGISGGR